jgi:hypothetical protein
LECAANVHLGVDTLSVSLLAGRSASNPHTLAVQSSEHDASSVPDGSKDTALTSSLCPT